MPIWRGIELELGMMLCDLGGGRSPHASLISANKVHSMDDKGKRRLSAGKRGIWLTVTAIIIFSFLRLVVKIKVFWTALVVVSDAVHWLYNSLRLHSRSL